MAEPVYNHGGQLTHVNFGKKKFTYVSKEKSDEFSLLTLAKYIYYYIDPSKIKFCFRHSVFASTKQYSKTHVLHILY